MIKTMMMMIIIIITFIIQHNKDKDKNDDSRFMWLDDGHLIILI